MARSLLELKIQGDVRREAKALQDVFLNTLGWNGIRKLEQFATVNAARAVQVPVKEAAPGGARGRIGAYVRGRRSRILRPGAIVGPVAGKKAAWYAKFVVYGTKRHDIPKYNVGSFLVFGGKVRTRVKHPGAKGNNFIGPTVDRNMLKVQEAFIGTIALFMRDEAMRNKVVGLELAYKGQTAAKWQQSEWGRHYKNADYLEPFHAAVREAPAGPAGQRSPAQMNRISASAALRDGYMARASGTISAVPRMKPRS